MVQRVQLVLEDDVDGGVADETVSFGLDGTNYEIDLSKEHATELREAFAPWVGAARKAKSATTASRSSRRSRSANNTAAIREWARAQGHTVSDRGRIAAEIVAAYEKANG
ncbi:histone-like nucleoid-structuring protein Lsr2 [Myceligenerans xiligouense]|uniref:Lsr2 protein n=1 Tax=Myceligenerans xiligouense TaxID=253184 RepID=A0A3N4Z118_9MICO|nr:Lsr2 family protein [Myceligenerans xiligouense]RPF19788.1 Lsr2 protein [Myceligenerans xiligouense]